MQYVVLFNGVNDAAQNIPYTTLCQNDIQMYNDVILNGSTPIIYLPVLANPVGTYAPLRANLTGLQNCLYTNGIPNSSVIEGYDALDSIPNNGIMDQWNSSNYIDTVHPNLVGQTALGEYLWNHYFLGQGFKPTAAFTATPLNGTAPLTVTFTDTSTGSPTSWNWTFSDGSLTNATQQNPVHTFTTPGTYEVDLKASNIYGNNWSNKTAYITFSAPVATYNWSFGDGSGPDYNQSPQHTYTTPGTYTVSLNATGPATVTAAFTTNTSSGVAPLTVQFTDGSTFGSGATQSNTATGTIQAFTNDPPLSISGLHNTTNTNTSILWLWNNPTDNNLNMTDVWANNVFFFNYTNSTTGVQWNGLTPGTSYTFSSRTHGLSGKVNSTWVNATATTISNAVPTPTPTAAPTSAANAACSQNSPLGGLSLLALALIVAGPLMVVIGYFKNFGDEGKFGTGIKSDLVIYGVLVFLIGGALLMLSYLFLGQLYMAAGC